MFLDFIRGTPKNLLQAFSGKNLIWHAIAIFSTAILVLSNFDWKYFEGTRSPNLFDLTLPAAILGFFFPIVVPVALYLWGEFRKKEKIKLTGAAIAEAEILGWLISVFYKSLTGRTQPEFLTNLSNLDISRDFHFGFLEHGIFWGWPSSHTAVAFAFAGVIFILYQKNNYLKTLVIIYALYIGFGVSVSIHWFSDFFAGAIFGLLAGIIVGKSFLNRYVFYSDTNRI